MVTDAKRSMTLGTKRQLPPRTYLEIKVAKQQTTELGGRLRWVSSERQFADGLTKGSTRGLLADRLRRHHIKLAWDPSYTSTKKQEREESRQEFADPKMKRKPIRKQSPQPEPSLHFTHQLDSVHEDEQQEDINENADRPWPSSLTLKTPMATLICFTQIKAVTAEFSGGYMPLDSEEVCLPGDDLLLKTGQS